MHAFFSFSLALVALGCTQAFLAPSSPCRTNRFLGTRTRLYSSVSGVMASVSPLSSRVIQISDSEDNSERVTQVKLNSDGTLEMVSDSTLAVEIAGNWKQGEDNKVGFILERFYSDNPDSKYSMTRIYEGSITISGSSIRGEGKIEMEKYNDLFTCGFFSLITVDDNPDDYFDKLQGHAVLEGVDQ